MLWTSSQTQPMPMTCYFPKISASLQVFLCFSEVKTSEVMVSLQIRDLVENWVIAF